MEKLNFWQAFAINTFAALLHTIMKDPKKYAAVETELQAIADDINEAFPRGLGVGVVQSTMTLPIGTAV